MTKKVACIFGANGQDGSYMAELLHSKGYEVHGAVRAPDKIQMLKNLISGINVFQTDYSDVESIIQYLKPTEIYNFMGYSNTFDPWKDVEENMKLNLNFPIKVLEAIKKVDKSIRFLQASSCLVFGKDESGYQNENTPRNPIHPYGVFKNAADNILKMYREEKALFACSGILFPHESTRRGEQFFTKKICMAVARIKAGSDEKIKINENSPERDWGHAKDYVDAAWRMLQHDKPMDFVIGTGRLTTVNKFIWKALEFAGLNPPDHVEKDESITRVNDLAPLCANTTKINDELGWYPQHSLDEIIQEMVSYELEQLKIKTI